MVKVKRISADLNWHLLEKIREEDFLDAIRALLEESPFYFESDLRATFHFIESSLTMHINGSFTFGRETLARFIAMLPSHIPLHTYKDNAIVRIKSVHSNDTLYNQKTLYKLFFEECSDHKAHAIYLRFLNFVRDFDLYEFNLSQSELVTLILSERYSDE